jgi:hypothetical protein
MCEDVCLRSDGVGTSASTALHVRLDGVLGNKPRHHRMHGTELVQIESRICESGRESSGTTVSQVGIAMFDDGGVACQPPSQATKCHDQRHRLTPSLRCGVPASPSSDAAYLN